MAGGSWGGARLGAGRPRKEQQIRANTGLGEARRVLAMQPRDRSVHEFGRQAIAYRHEFEQAAGQLVGIAQGLLADQELNDEEVQFLGKWIAAHDAIQYDWPGNILHARVTQVLADGVITEQERDYLVATLQSLIGAEVRTESSVRRVTELAYDEPSVIMFDGFTFCLTGEFVYAPRDVCAAETARRGGIISSGISRKLNYLVVGSKGSVEWKRGSYGTKIERAMQLKEGGASIIITREDAWVSALKSQS